MVKAIVGANWGDEGKGKITDLSLIHISTMSPVPPPFAGPFSGFTAI